MSSRSYTLSLVNNISKITEKVIPQHLAHILSENKHRLGLDRSYPPFRHITDQFNLNKDTGLLSKTNIIAWYTECFIKVSLDIVQFIFRDQPE